MKPYKNKNERERDTPKGKKKPREKKPWIKEYQWKSKAEYDKWPKHWSWLNKNKEYSDCWTQDWFGSRFKNPEGALDSIKHELRSMFQSKYIKGRNWRVRNDQTGEIVEFPDIENYYS